MSAPRNLDELAHAALVSHHFGSLTLISEPERKIILRACGDRSPRACGHVHNDWEDALDRVGYPFGKGAIRFRVVDNPIERPKGVG